LCAFLLRYGKCYSGKSNWTQAHYRWLEEQQFRQSVQQIVFQERTVGNVLIEGHYDKHVAYLRERLFNAHQRVAQAMSDSGLKIFHRPEAGLFLWAKLPISAEDSLAVSTKALAQGIWLAPGSYFRPGEPKTEWFRFNAATSDVPELWDFVRSL
jgi:DNA-binding transcriptional MocR family regulator